MSALHYYVDESGHTGVNLFDVDQPILYYGVIGGRTNLDLLAQSTVARLCRSIGLKRLHAAELPPEA